MRFSTSFLTSLKKVNKLAGLAVAVMILPVAVACTPQAAEETGADVTSELPEGAEAIEDEVAVDGIEEPADMAAGDIDGGVATGESIVDVAAANGSFDTLVAAVQAAGLEETLDADGPYTLFAPTDEAFAALPEGTVEKLVKPENQDALNQVLAYHVVSGAVAASEIEPGSVSTVEGSDVQVAIDPTGLTVNEAAVVQPDVVAENGVIHVVDTVLLPPTFDPSTLL
ncbi:MAG: fasciclin domain-containing protein [Cyanobacteria bacterium J06650_10]